eukprot:Skav218052  [mRNA]  locus=scaffold214:1356925:1357464:+ [translate_table: standard]
MDNFNVNHHPFGAPHANFCMCARSAISFFLWGVWMKLQELVHHGTSLREHPLLHSALAMISVQLDSVRLQQCLDRQEVSFWNRNYVDFFLNVNQNWNFSTSEKESMRVYLISPQLTSVMMATSLFVNAPHHQSAHPTSLHFRFMHLWLPRNDFRRLNHVQHGDWHVPLGRTLQRRPAKL